MTVNDILCELEQLGSERVREQNARNGATGPQFGVKMGDIRAVAKKIKPDVDFARALWATGNIDARLVSVLVTKPKQLSSDEVEAMVSEATYPWLADWLSTNIYKQHPEKQSLRVRWMHSDDPMLARAGWSLTTERVVKSPDGLDLGALLDRIERELPTVPEASAWTMNFCLGEIGIHHPQFRERVLAIGEKIGKYSDYPCSKGCIPPYVPVWVREIVARQGG
ncbi:MAG TPA: DNA alkylation repair protein [Fimbriimonadaceae bacterium]|nr:DNA alkylation repair protein [Fimbriimonadaceae bacterium]